jgi:hypothetical protein
MEGSKNSSGAEPLLGVECWPRCRICNYFFPYRYGFNNPVRVTDPTGMFEYVKGGYGEDIEVGNVWSHTEDGGFLSDLISDSKDHGRVVW